MKAPWTAAQIEALNAYQALGYVHEFTCSNEQGDCKVRTLTATPDGWVCLGCGYKQDWAHGWMADKSQHPHHPFEAFPHLKP